MESVNLDDGYEEVSGRDGYRIYRKILRDDNGKIIKGIWAAQDWDGKDEPFEITYDQARGFEPINPQLGNLQKKVSKALGFGRYRDIEESMGSERIVASSFDKLTGDDYDLDIDESLEMLESARRSKKAISEFYRYSYDNQKISDILDKIEQTNDQRKIDRAYNFIHHACDNIDDCMGTGFYDLSDASWGYGTDYIIEELTDILNESIKQQRRKKSRRNEVMI